MLSAVGERLGPGVRHQKTQTVRKALSSRDLQRVVVRHPNSLRKIPHLEIGFTSVLREGAQGLGQRTTTGRSIESFEARRKANDVR